LYIDDLTQANAAPCGLKFLPAAHRANSLRLPNAPLSDFGKWMRFYSARRSVVASARGLPAVKKESPAEAEFP